MNNYNAAFFGLYERVYLTYRDLHGESQAIQFMRALFARALGPAYEQMGYEKGKPSDFARVVGQRDAGVGLDVRFPIVEDTRIVYQFHTDPFPNLKGLVTPAILDSCYMAFKVQSLLGDQWTYTTTQHLWNGAPYTEHVITKK